MFRFFLTLFSSPESLLQVMSRRAIAESIEDGERILIDEDGSASVNIYSPEVREDFVRHVAMLRGT
ncbi:hypothetical protein [Erwinia amylovora]|uniref:Uncharacterized protein n=1 Tax=Erwinia amylovora ATCC BAA-2158 TaxID=889211 RepID=E5B2P1_ERWAM|nr:hypothetical protein [Erwinia amylovora]CBX79743.1 hypothetical protein predicted by Glimmer/Critica [Erwinia amylovora ATCC BAA-2158]